MRALGRPLRREQVKARPAGLVEQKQCLKSPQGKTFKAREEECFKEKRKASCSVGAAAEKELPSSRSKSLTCRTPRGECQEDFKALIDHQKEKRETSSLSHGGRQTIASLKQPA
jgi:hypothetical protein